MSMKRLILLPFLAFCFFAEGGFSSYAQSRNDKQIYFDALQTTGTILSSVQRYFVDTIDLPTIHALGMNAMLSRLDPYTEYMSPKEAQAFREATTGVYAGIGAIISQRPDSTVIINEPFEGQPAERAGLKPGDHILRIDGKSYARSTTPEVSNALRGKEGTEILLVVQRAGEPSPREFRFMRQKISLNSVAYAGRLAGDIGIIRLSQFTQDSGKDLREALSSLTATSPLKGLIIDLRSNGGGVMQSAIEIVSLFVPHDTEVLSVKGRDVSSNNSYRTTSAPIALDLPLVVLINEESASSSEIVAGALQDRDRAVIIGEKSYGKGLVQSTIQTPGEGLLKLTTARYYIPSGRCIQKIAYNHLGDRAQIAEEDSLGAAFSTLGGRTVYDAGGIMPDLKVEADTMASMLAYMSVDTLVFDYVTRYEATHKNLASPEQFHLTDAEYNDFITYLSTHGFTYQPRSLKYLDQMQELINYEQVPENAAKEMEALRKVLEPDIKRDGTRFKRDIKEYIESQIMLRRYHRKGYFGFIMPGDKQVKAACEVLANPSRYKGLLAPPKGTSPAKRKVK